MRRKFTSNHSLTVTFVTLLLLLSAAFASTGASAVLKCGQPVSAGSQPTASDSLVALKAAVGLPSCDVTPCVCDVTAPSGITATDALSILRAAVGLATALTCSCAPCSSFAFSATDGGVMDSGWTGKAHGVTLPRGDLFGAAVAKRCAGDGSTCTSNADCDDGKCQSTCDCQADTACDIVGPTSPRRCLSSHDTCTSNADCSSPCVHLLGPPTPLSLAGNPVCVVTYFDSEMNGMFDVSTGNLRWDAVLRRRSHLGISLDQPCPRCGAPEEDPSIGDASTCVGGSNNGLVCIVDAVHPEFGGTSYGCPPTPSQFVNSVPFRLNATTDSIERTAQFACSGGDAASHPSRGTGKCVDNEQSCSSNADCMRCVADTSLPCASNAECGDVGPCAAAPDQPISCGYWCHCGICGDASGLSCFSNADCAEGVSCVADMLSMQQLKPNDCVNDDHICGTSSGEECATTRLGECAAAPERLCATDSDCLAAGPCVPNMDLPCFEHKISRNGESASFTTLCRTAPSTLACQSSASCGMDDECIEASDLRVVAVYCSPGEQTILNAAAGLPGPTAWAASLRVEACACGDGTVGCNEACDDSNTSSGDGCDEFCALEK